MSPLFSHMHDSLVTFQSQLEKEIKQEKIATERTAKLPITRDDIVNLVIDLNITTNIKEFLILESCDVSRSEWIKFRKEEA